MLLLFVFFIIVNAKAQTNYLPGFIVTLEGDSITGLVDSRGEIRNSRVCSYKTDMESEPVKYQPGEIKAYGFVDGKYYVSKDIVLNQDSTTVFLEYLINGIVDVYFYSDHVVSQYYIDKDGMKPTLLDNKDIIVDIDGKKMAKKNSRYIGVLKYVFNESPKVQKKAEGISLTHKNLIKIAKDYHGYVCEGEECIVYEKKKLKVKFNIEPIVGIDFHNLVGTTKNMKGVSYSEADVYVLPTALVNFPEEFKLKSSGFNYSFGLRGSVLIPSFNQNLALNLQVKYGIYKIYGDVELTDGKIATLLTEGKSLMNNLYFSYTFPRGMIRPVFLAGFSYSYFTSVNDLNIIKHINSTNYILFKEQDTDIIDEKYVGAVIGAGFNIPVFKKYMLSTTAQYNFMGDSDSRNSGYSYNPLSIILGFKF